MPGLLDPCDPPPTDRPPAAHPRPAATAAAGSGEARPLEVLDRSFRLLVCEPAPLALDGFAVDGLPDRPIPLDELRGMLLHPSVGFDTRDTALTWLVGRAQAEGGAWLVGLAGVLLPGIGRRVYPLCRAFPRLAHDLEAEALAGLLQAVQAWRLGAGPGRDPAGVGGRPGRPSAAAPRDRGGGAGGQRRVGAGGAAAAGQPTASWSSTRRSGPGCCRRPTPS